MEGGLIGRGEVVGWGEGLGGVELDLGRGGEEEGCVAER